MIERNTMSKIKEKYHYRLANKITIWPLMSEGFPEMFEDMVAWFFEMQNMEGVTVEVELKDNMNCWGDSQEVTDDDWNTYYDIRVCLNQPLRDFVATLMHELVHVQQWVENEWDGDGEKEAEKRQYELADAYWKGWE